MRRNRNLPALYSGLTATATTQDGLLVHVRRSTVVHLAATLRNAFDIEVCAEESHVCVVWRTALGEGSLYLKTCDATDAGSRGGVAELLHCSYAEAPTLPVVVFRAIEQVTLEQHRAAPQAPCRPSQFKRAA